jgi:hypothetical protein
MSLDKIARNQYGDALYAVLGPLAHRIASEDWDVFAKQTEFERLRRGQKTAASLITYSLLKPLIVQGFASATIASACMTETTLFRVWSAQGVEMKPVGEALRKHLRYTKHEHGDRITIYFASHEGWSKRFRDRAVKDASGAETRVLERIRQAIATLVGTERFVWMGNKDLDDGFFGLAGAERLPNTPHGLNSFQGYHNVVVLSALNPPPAHFHFMGARGVSDEELRTGCYRTAVYQAVMRCSIRNPADTTPKRVIVMDRDTAEWLADLFPGAQVMPLPGLGALPSKGKAGRPRQHADNAARTRAYRAEQKSKHLAQLDLINGTSFIRASYPLLAEQVRGEMREFVRDDIPSKGGDYVTPLPAASAMTCGTAYLSKYDSMPFEHFVHYTDDGFIAELRDLHTRRVLKDESGLFSPAHFDPSKAADTDRGLDNIVHLRGIWLDNDGGDLTHAAFADLFPYLRVVVWNTASSTAAAPRWRAFIPTTYAYSLDVLALIMDQIEKVLNRAGYWGKRQIEKQAKRPNATPGLCHGFDEGKFNGAALFYLPVQAQDPADSFFIDYGEVDPKRGPLDLHDWIEHCILDLRHEPEPVRPENIVALPVPAIVSTRVAEPVTGEKRQVSAKLQAVRDAMAARDAHLGADRRATLIEKAIQDWRMTPRGSGHAAFFSLAAALQRAGLDLGEIRDKLWEEAAYGNSPKKRRGEIKDILKSLGRRGTLAGGSVRSNHWWN